MSAKLGELTCLSFPTNEQLSKDEITIQATSKLVQVFLLAQ
jgi:hypothetical protein